MPNTQLGEQFMPRPGQKVLVPTDVKAGAFPGERLVTLETASGPISGFAKADAIIDRVDGNYIVAEVKSVSQGISVVKLAGSFFTTTGLASIQSARLKAAG
jgi:hypothetical protein